MSESTRATVIRAYLDRINQNDLEGSEQYITDDFVYEIEPKPDHVGYGSGYDKAKYKDFHAAVTKAYSEIETTIVNITETDGKAIVNGKSKFKYTKDGAVKTGETSFTSEVVFSGNKICSMKAVGDPSFAAKFV